MFFQFFRCETPLHAGIAPPDPGTGTGNIKQNTVAGGEIPPQFARMRPGADIENTGPDSPAAKFIKFVGPDITCDDGSFVFHHGCKLQGLASGSGTGIKDTFARAGAADGTDGLTGKILDFKTSFGVSVKGEKIDFGRIDSKLFRSAASS